MEVTGRARRLAIGGVALAVAAQAASLGLVGLSGWFIAASAVAGTTLASTFSYLAPSGGIRAFALTRIGTAYCSRLVLHAASLAAATRERGRLVAALRTRSGRAAPGAAAQALLGDVAVANEHLIRVTAPAVVFGIGAAASTALVAAISPAAAAGLAVSAAAVAIAVAGADGGRRLDVAALRQEVVAAVDAWPEMRGLDAVDVLRSRVLALAAQVDAALEREQRSDRAVEVRAGAAAAIGLATVLVLLTTGTPTDLPALTLVALLSAGALESGAALGTAAGARRTVRAARERVRSQAAPQPDRAVGGARTATEILAAASPGATVVLHGPSGSGKSTALAAAQSVLGDAEALLVPPNAHLFTGTVRTNLQLASPTIEDSELVGLLEAVELVRNGVTPDTPVGDGGRPLSGGEHQRLVLARAVAARPSVLLLDEPATGLSADQARRVVGAVRRLLPDCALVIAMHEDALAIPHRSIPCAAPRPDAAVHAGRAVRVEPRRRR